MILNKRLLAILLIVVIQLGVGIVAYSQEASSFVANDIFYLLQEESLSAGEVILYQEASLNVLVDKHKRINKKSLTGYRIQIYRGSGQEARDNANKASQTFSHTFPSFNQSQIYPIYESPYFKLRIGDYRTKNEAFELLYRVRKIFPNAYIVNTEINFPKLSVGVDQVQAVDSD